MPKGTETEHWTENIHNNAIKFYKYKTTEFCGTNLRAAIKATT